MNVKQAVMERAVQPAMIKYLQLRRDPLARMLGKDFITDPYALYTELRATGPVQTKLLGMWVISRHDDVMAVLRDPRANHDLTKLKKPPVPAKQADDDPVANLPGNSEILLMMDPPDHTRVRRLVGKAFSPKAIDALGPWLQEFADGLVDDAKASGEMDVIDQIGFPVPMTAICKILGVPTSDQEQFKKWGHIVGGNLDIQLKQSEQDKGNRAAVEVCAYFEELIEDHRTNPQDDLLSELIAVEEEGDRLTGRELLGTCFLLLIAGFETTVSLIGNGMLALQSTRTNSSDWSMTPR